LSGGYGAAFSVFLLSIMIQFCARWAGRIQVDSDLAADYPPLLLRIEYALLFIENVVIGIAISIADALVAPA
jgi:hypothetical protein